MKKIYLTLIWCLICTCNVIKANASQDIFVDLKSTVIAIQAHETLNAYGTPIIKCGTGFLADKANGIIVTNRHLASID